MAEWHPSGYAQQRHPAGQGAGGVEWYSAGGAQTYGAAGSSYNYDVPGGAGGTGGAAYGSFDDEAPLLEGEACCNGWQRSCAAKNRNRRRELGIDIPAILRRTRSILTFRLGGHEMLDLDLGGPLLFMAALGVAHLLVGKMHFGYILGWMVVGSMLLWFVLNSITGTEDPEAKALDLYACTCLLGYALLPLVGHAALALLVPRRSLPSVLAAGAAVLWAGQTASRLFCRRSQLLAGQQSVVLYPCLLMYSSFALLSLY